MVLITINVPHEIRGLLKKESNQSALITNLLMKHYEKDGVVDINILIEKEKNVKKELKSKRNELKSLQISIKEADNRAKEAQIQADEDKSFKDKNDKATDELRDAILKEVEG